jgi:hypothetical protein
LILILISTALLDSDEAEALLDTEGEDDVDNAEHKEATVDAMADVGCDDAF